MIHNTIIYNPLIDSLWCDYNKCINFLRLFFLFWSFAVILLLILIYASSWRFSSCVTLLFLVPFCSSEHLYRVYVGTFWTSTRPFRGQNLSLADQIGSMKRTYPEMSRNYAFNDLKLDPFKMSSPVFYLRTTVDPHTRTLAHLHTDTFKRLDCGGLFQLSWCFQRFGHCWCDVSISCSKDLCTKTSQTPLMLLSLRTHGRTYCYSEVRIAITPKAQHNMWVLCNCLG